MASELGVIGATAGAGFLSGLVQGFAGHFAAEKEKEERAKALVQQAKMQSDLLSQEARLKMEGQERALILQSFIDAAGRGDAGAFQTDAARKALSGFRPEVGAMLESFGIGRAKDIQRQQQAMMEAFTQPTGRPIIRTDGPGPRVRGLVPPTPDIIARRLVAAGVVKPETALSAMQSEEVNRRESERLRLEVERFNRQGLDARADEKYRAATLAATQESNRLGFVRTLIWEGAGPDVRMLAQQIANDYTAGRTPSSQTLEAYSTAARAAGQAMKVPSYIRSQGLLTELRDRMAKINPPEESAEEKLEGEIGQFKTDYLAILHLAADSGKYATPQEFAQFVHSTLPSKAVWPGTTNDWEGYKDRETIDLANRRGENWQPLKSSFMALKERLPNGMTVETTADGDISIRFEGESFGVQPPSEVPDADLDPARAALGLTPDGQ